MSYYQKKRQGGFYNQRNQKKKRNFVLEPGIKGFMCTCNSREKDCVREAYNILNDYADRLYGLETKRTPEESKETETSLGSKELETTGENPEEEEDEDISTALSKEIADMKQNPNKSWRFQVVESGANNCVFIKTTLADPTELAHFIMKDIESTKKQRSRFLLRLIPVEVTCKAYMDEIRKSAATLFDKYFSVEGKSFAIVFNHRNNHSISRSDIIEEFAEMVKFRHPNNKVDLSQPELTIIVEVVRAMCCMSVVPDYFKLLKYNLLELCGKGEKAAREAKKESEKEKSEVETSTTEAQEGKEEGEKDGGGDKEIADDKESTTSVSNEEKNAEEAVIQT